MIKCLLVYSDTTIQNTFEDLLGHSIYTIDIGDLEKYSRQDFDRQQDFTLVSTLHKMASNHQEFQRPFKPYYGDRKEYPEGLTDNMTD